MGKSYNNNLKILSWAEEDRPREKLLLKGRESLSDAELIAILIGSGSQHLSAVDLSRTILQSVGNNLNGLAKMDVKELIAFKGIGEAKAISIISALELGRRRKEADFESKPKISSSLDAYNYMKPHLLDLPHEEFWVLLLNRANQVLKPIKISQGGVSAAIVDQKLVFKQAINHLASNILLVHNHPSGSLTPSANDVNITKNLINSGKVIEIPILDHIIFTDHGYFSFADEQQLN